MSVSTFLKANTKQWHAQVTLNLELHRYNSSEMAKSGHLTNDMTIRRLQMCSELSNPFKCIATDTFPYRDTQQGTPQPMATT